MERTWLSVTVIYLLLGSAAAAGAAIGQDLAREAGGIAGAAIFAVLGLMALSAVATLEDADDE